MSASSEPADATSADVSAEAAVILPADLHARPAGQLVQLAASFQSTIRLDHGGRTIDPTGILSVMSLGARAGSTMTIHAAGPDAAHAAQQLAQLLSEID